MATGFDYLSHDDVLQRHWLKRFVAIVVDSIIIWVPLWIILTILGVSSLISGGLFGVLFFLYASFFDLEVGGTPGKIFLRLKAVSTRGHMSAAQAFMRNISKIFFLILLLDWIVGMVLDTNDPRQKWTDRMAETSVIVYDHPGGT